MVLGSQTRHREDVEVIQVGEAGPAGLGIVLIGNTGKRSQCHFVPATALMIISLNLISVLTLGIVNTLNCSSDAVCKARSPCKSGTCTRSHEATQSAGSVWSRTSRTPKPPMACSAQCVGCSSSPAPPTAPASFSLLALPSLWQIWSPSSRHREVWGALHIQGTCQEVEAAHSAGEGVFSQQGSMWGCTGIIISTSWGRACFTHAPPALAVSISCRFLPETRLFRMNRCAGKTGTVTS